MESSSSNIQIYSIANQTLIEKKEPKQNWNPKSSVLEMEQKFEFNTKTGNQTKRIHKNETKQQQLEFNSNLCIIENNK